MTYSQPADSDKDKISPPLDNTATFSKFVSIWYNGGVGGGKTIATDFRTWLKSVQLPQIIFAVCLLNIVGFFNLDYFRDNFTPDDVKEIDARFAAARAQIGPPAVLGYIADNEKEKDGAVDLLSMRRFFKVQYAMAPAILVHSVDQKKIIANFSSVEAGAEMISRHGLEVERDFGGGVYLLRHAGGAQ